MTIKNIISIFFLVGVFAFVGHLSYAMGKVQKSEPSQKGQVTYTCPMHPQISQDHPGSCSICGMNLVKKDDKASLYKELTCSCCGKKQIL